MCFVKTLVLKKAELESAFAPIAPQKSPITQEQSTPCQWNENEIQQKMDLFSLFQTLLVTNSAALIHAQKQVNEVIENIQKADSEMKILEEPKIEEISEFYECEQAEPMVRQIFGDKKYKFKLELIQKIPEVLYKQRNFNFQIQLTDGQGRPVRNANIIPICVGALTTTGQWINQNRQGQCLIKGKSEMDLYRGRAEFQKIYLRQVSRPYPEGKVHLVVYAKPSMMKCLNHADYEEKVSEEDIMPLIIKDLSVKAKKK